MSEMDRTKPRFVLGVLDKALLALRPSRLDEMVREAGRVSALQVDRELQQRLYGYAAVNPLRSPILEMAPVTVTKEGDKVKVRREWRVRFGPPPSGWQVGTVCGMWRTTVLPRRRSPRPGL